jgi:dTMP kinase
MAEKKGMFVVFEGIDGSGKDVQMELLAKHIRELDKYNEVLLAREPTHKAKKIKEALSKEKDAFSGGKRLAELYVTGDRVPHTNELIIPVLKWGAFVLSSRYSMSTLAYQYAQGVPLNDLLKMHEKTKTLTPDLTFYLNVPFEVAKARKELRGENLEKFERDEEFIGQLLERYGVLVELSTNNRVRNVIGLVKVINGAQEIPAVAADVRCAFDKVYDLWTRNEL